MVQPTYVTVNGFEFAVYKRDDARIWDVYRAVQDGYMGQVRSDGHWVWTHDNTGERSSALDAFTTVDAALRSLVRAA